jgi:peptidoglycan/xylan/chitin deacetylase (PgdA/CDA1 family)
MESTFAGHRVRRRAMLKALAALPLPLHADTPPAVPVLTYHRFADTVLDAMTLRRATFDGHLAVLRALDCRVIRLGDLVDWRLGRRAAPPRRAVVITADDGHRSQVEVMVPRLAQHGWPATLFIYPSAVSNARYAMTWPDLRALAAGGGIDVESHTFWHANLVQERRLRSPDDFDRFARDQLLRARQRLASELGRWVRLLAWPFGLADSGLMALAADTGHEASFVLGNKPVTESDPVQALPRWLMTDALSPAGLERLLRRAFSGTSA